MPKYFCVECKKYVPREKVRYYEENDKILYNGGLVPAEEYKVTCEDCAFKGFVRALKKVNWEKELKQEKDPKMLKEKIKLYKLVKKYGDKV